MTSWEQRIHDLEAQHVAAAKAEQNGTAATGTVAAVRFVTLEEFIAIDEPSAEPLLGSGDETVIPVGGDVITYGKAGAGKTTWTLDGVIHLAAGVRRLGFGVPCPVTVGIIENEGPRGKFRLKLKTKLAAWTGRPTTGRVHVLEEPWSRFTFEAPVQRIAVAEYVNAGRIDLLVCGPIATVGMVGGGTPDEINAFMAHVDESARSSRSHSRSGSCITRTAPARCPALGSASQTRLSMSRRRATAIPASTGRRRVGRASCTTRR